MQKAEGLSNKTSPSRCLDTIRCYEDSAPRFAEAGQARACRGDQGYRPPSLVIGSQALPPPKAVEIHLHVRRRKGTKMCQRSTGPGAISRKCVRGPRAREQSPCKGETTCWHSQRLNRARPIYERHSLTPEALASDPVLEFEEIKRVRKEEATKHPTWKYANANRAFEEPPLYSCTDSFKKILGAHLKQAVKKISRHYEAMDEGTVRLSEEKANVGADLWLMKSSLDEVHRGLRKAREIERLKLLKRGKDGMKVAPERFGAPLGDNFGEQQTIQTEDGSESLG
ncbi:unnamed protein product [Ascophyllum nodosum]